MRKKSARQIVRCESLQAGFTLLELAVVMIVIGILIIPLIGFYNNYVMQKIMIKTNGAMAETTNAIQRFYLLNGRYPCPAGRGNIPGDANYGVEQCPTGLAPESCDGQGICRVAGIDPNKTVLIGAVPFASMDMQADDTIDGYYSKLTYIVTADLTNEATFSTTSISQQVQIVNSSGVVAETVQGALISHGRNRIGAYSVNSRTPVACGGGTADTENCDVDNRVTGAEHREYSETAANYFDDVLVKSDWTNSSIWEYTPNSPDDIYSRNSGNVGIGTSTPEAKLDVSGNLRADQLNAPSICNREGENCFSPDLIGGPEGVAISCKDEVMRGIENGKPICSGIKIDAMKGQSCGKGEFVQGIVNGEVICSAP